MNGLALCAGSGMLEEGVRAAMDIADQPYKTVCYVEREASAAATLVARMEEASLDKAPVWDNVATFRGGRWRGAVDIITGGYPCQPFSNAGKRRGRGDPRHLWPAIARIIRDVRPALCFLENVEGHLSLGFEPVCHDLRGLGYLVAAGLFSAAEVGASHRRQRLFILAAKTMADHDSRAGSASGPEKNGRLQPCEADNGCQQLADAHGPRAQGQQQKNSAQGWREPDESSLFCGGTGLPFFPPGPDAFEEWRAILGQQPEVEPSLCGVVDGMAHRVDRLRLCGNGVVPLQAAYAFIALAGSFAGEGGGGWADASVVRAGA